MTNLGVFRDEFYNAIATLTKSQGVTGPAATGVIPAAALAGAQVCYTSVSGTSQTFTTDSAVNIIAQVQQAVAAAMKANVGGFSAALGAIPASAGLPNFFNLSWVVEMSIIGVVTAGTLALGTGVTVSAISGLSTTSLLPAAGSGGIAKFVVTITGPTSVNFQRVF